MSIKPVLKLFGILTTILLLLLSPLVIVETFVDPYPNSIWALRILNTKYIVHARAELEIDGEPLVLERSIRCFNAVDYEYYPSSSPRGDVLSSNGSTADTLAGKTKSGRLFALHVTKACGVLRSKMRNNDELFFKHQNLGDYEYLEPVYLSKGDIDVPVVFELFMDGKTLKQVDAYFSRKRLREGYHGVKLKELVVSRVPEVIEKRQRKGFQGVPLNEFELSRKDKPMMYQDWAEYDWFGKPNWHRRAKGNRGLYYSYYGFKVPKERFNEITDHYIKNAFGVPPDEEKISSIVSEFTGNVDRGLSLNNPFSFFHLKVHNIMELSFFYRDLLLSRTHTLSSQENVEWFISYFFPCLPKAKGTKVNDFFCNENLNGVISVVPYNLHIDQTDLRFNTGGSVFKSTIFSPQYQFSSEKSAIYGFEAAMTYLGEMP